MEKESRGDETEDGEEILAVQLKAEKSRQSYADFLRKFSVSPLTNPMICAMLPLTYRIDG